MLIAQLLAGGLILTFGRRLFWLFVAACGFTVGLSLASRLLPTQPEWLVLLIGVAIGVLAALLAVFFQRVAIGVAGFLAGAVIASNLLGILALQGDAFFWVAFGIGGVLGAVVMEIVFDWGLIALSAFAGSSLVVGALQLPIRPACLLWLALLGLGLAAQIAQMRQQGRLPTQRAP